MSTWYRTVGFGGCPAPQGPWNNTADATRALTRWINQRGAQAGTLIAAHSIRINEYETRAQARAGDISDDYRDGLLGITGLHEWLANHR